MVLLGQDCGLVESSFQAVTDETTGRQVVDLKYPSDSGLQSRLETVGYRVAWCLETNLARRVDLEGWEVVLEDDHGVPTRFRVKDRPADQILIKKRVGSSQP